MRTPKEILENLALRVQYLYNQNYYKGVNYIPFITQALKEIEAYYVLSDDELKLLLPKKREVLKQEESGGVAYASGFNRAIDLIFKALQGKIPRRLSVEEIKQLFGYSDIGFIHDMDCPCKISPDDGELYSECKCRKLNELARAIYDAQRKE